MLALLALTPCLTLLVTIVVLGRGGLTGATCALVVTLMLWAGGVFSPADGRALADALVDAALLTAVVASVILPGLAFVATTERCGSREAIGELVARLELSPQRAALLIAAGVGVTVESVTGMGVSLLVTVPLLARLLGPTRTVAVALAGMSLMPWGAVALGTIVGAKIAGIDLATFGHAVWVQSGPIAFLVPLVVVAVLPGRAAADIALAAVAGLVMVAVLGGATRVLGIEVAGAFAGLAVAAVVAGPRLRSMPDALRDRRLAPYAVLLAAVVLQKLLLRLLDGDQSGLTLSTGRIVWDPVTTPGVALAVATIAAGGATRLGGAWGALARRSARVMAAIVVFLAGARLLLESGGIDALVASISGLGATWALTATGALGSLSGFIAGSAVVGNALFMPSAAEVGSLFDARELFAALQNAGAAHGAVASLPLATLVAAAMPGDARGVDRTAMRIGLVLAGVYAITMIAWAHLR
ncbi:MAG: hypothetical protein H6983_11780 [Ectothiorhodospiraceae bacterium]|nr:hypothetical protein [Chromatiales bacterium]MCP5154840.1 hypothetical protein [Ectothiorhodospiraceae bacterium]